MARIVIITHAHVDFMHRDYLLHSIAPHWVAAGHQVLLAVGLVEWPEADIAVLHVDLSVIPATYAEACKRYAVDVNGAVGDIRKRQVSQCLLQPGDDWRGPVIVKTDLNCGGLPELYSTKASLRDGKPEDSPFKGSVCTARPYRILDSIRDVPETIWINPGLVASGCSLAIASAACDWTAVSQSANVVGRESVDVPDALRAARERLGFDYGKFDFVMHEGKLSCSTPIARRRLPPHARTSNWLRRVLICHGVRISS